MASPQHVWSYWHPWLDLERGWSSLPMGCCRPRHHGSDVEQVADQPCRQRHRSCVPHDRWPQFALSLITIGVSFDAWVSPWCLYGLTCLNLPGKNDLRVPPSQGYEYYHALKVAFMSTTFPFQLFHDHHFPNYFMITTFHFQLSLLIQALGKTVKMNVYDDNHPLAKPENDVNVMINAAIFFKECLGIE